VYTKLLQEVTEEMARTISSSGWMNEVVERSIAAAGHGVSQQDVKDTVIKTAIPRIHLSLRQVSESILNATQKVSELI
jgi:AAA+ superfamily predicted ATPase